MSQKRLTLLQKALAIPTNEAPKMSAQEVELALGWVDGKVTNRQILGVIREGKKNAGGAAVYVFLAHALKTHLLNIK